MDEIKYAKISIKIVIILHTHNQKNKKTIIIYLSVKPKLTL